LVKRVLALSITLSPHPTDPPVVAPFIYIFVVIVVANAVAANVAVLHPPLAITIHSSSLK
jgi:hypothetical protein